MIVPHMCQDMFRPSSVPGTSGDSPRCPGAACSDGVDLPDGPGTDLAWRVPACSISLLMENPILHARPSGLILGGYQRALGGQLFPASYYRRWNNKRARKTRQESCGPSRRSRGLPSCYIERRRQGSRTVCYLSDYRRGYYANENERSANLQRTGW